MSAARWDHWLGFALLVLIGGKMLFEAVRHEPGESTPSILGPRTSLVLSIATSIGALAAGVTLPTLAAAPVISVYGSARHRSCSARSAPSSAGSPDATSIGTSDACSCNTMSDAYPSEADRIEPQRRMAGLPALGHVLVATDFSARGRIAIERAASLSFSPGGRLEIVHVATSECDEAEIRQRLDEEREQFIRGVTNATILTSVAHGDAADEICRRAHHTRAELIVVGRHGTRTWKDAVLGSTAERIVRHGSTSTLIAAARPRGAYCRPLVAVDLSASSRLALELAARISRPTRDEICALHVTSIKNADEDPAIAYVTNPEVQREMVFASAHKRLSEFLAGIPDSIRWRPSVRFGDPSAWILEASRQRNCDVIAIGSGGKGLVRRALLGSVAERIIHEAACDVLVARLPEV